MLSNELKELERRIIADIRDQPIENEYDMGIIDGLKLSLYELNALDKLYVGGKISD